MSKIEKIERSEFTAEELEMAIEVRKEYMRQWRKKNPDKVKAAQLRYFLKKAKQEQASGDAE